MKFYFTPGSCSTGIHLLLEELDLIYEAYLVNLIAGDHLKSDYLALNPKSTIPTLQLDDGTVITEFQAIAWYLACSYPAANLLPGEIPEQVKTIEQMNYIIGTIHGQGFARIFTTEQFCPLQSGQEAVRQKGLEIIQKGFDIIDADLADRAYLTNQFSIADAALFYVEFWADKCDIALPENCQRHYQLMLARPVVQRVLQEEGYQLKTGPN